MQRCDDSSTANEEHHCDTVRLVTKSCQPFLSCFANPSVNHCMWKIGRRRGSIAVQSERATQATCAESSFGMSQTASEIVDPDKVEDGFLSLTFGLLHGPIVQFAAPPPGQSQASVIAMPQQLPLSVDPVFVFPKEASLPDSIAHFCFAPVLKLHEPSELTFTLTDSKGNELHGVSLQVLVPHPSSTKGSGPKHRPVAICMISGRPIFKVLSQLLRSLLPLVQHAKVPTTKRTRELKVRVSRNQYGLGLVMGQNNVVMSVEAGSMAAKERQVRPQKSSLNVRPS